MTTEDTNAADRGAAGNNLLGLVERLRELSRRGHWPLIGDEAADEIERLRAELARRERGERICTKCGVRQDGYDAAGHSAAYPGF